MKSDPAATPPAYFLTWTARGTWLRGDDRGSVSKHANTFGSPVLAPDPARARNALRRMQTEPLVLNDDSRRIVTRAIEQEAEHHGWKLHALNVRTNHVHVVIASGCKPERILACLKAAATQSLRRLSLIEPSARPWTHHGSTRYLWNGHGLRQAMDYVVNHQ